MLFLGSVSFIFQLWYKYSTEFYILYHQGLECKVNTQNAIILPDKFDMLEEINRCLASKWYIDNYW